MLEFFPLGTGNGSEVEYNGKQGIKNKVKGKGRKGMGQGKERGKGREGTFVKHLKVLDKVWTKSSGLQI